MVLNEDSTPNSPGNPAAVGSLVTFSATGEGQTDPPGVDGKVAADALPAPTQSVSVRIGGKEAPVIHVGAVAGLPAGFFQVTARVPDVEPTPYQIPVVLTVGGVSTQPGVTMSVQLQGGAPATSMTLDSPRGLAFDDWGNLYIADRSANRVLKMAPSGAIDTFAGAGTAGFGNDGGPAAAALLNTPRAVAVDKSGAVYIADTGNSRIRRVSPDGVIQTVAGQGVAGVTGDGGPAISGRVNLPSGVAVDRSGNLYLSEFSSGRVRIISNGIINTFAGSDTRIGFSGDGGPAIAAGLVNPYGVAVDTRGNVYIADQGDHRVRKVNQAGVISTIDGNGARGSGPNLLSLPTDVAADATGNVYIADASNNRIVKVTVSGEFIILAGDGRAGDSGDGGPATAARLSNPQGVAVDGAGNVYVSDTNNNRVRKITPQGVITTVAGVQ